LIAHEIRDFNPKNYVYDYEGAPLFVKIYLGDQNFESEYPQRKRTPHSSIEKELQFFTSMMQTDSQGSFLAVPIQKKKKKDTDNDESTWVCPYCDTENPAFEPPSPKGEGFLLHRSP
jgi:hypothetical protein